MESERIELEMSDTRRKLANSVRERLERFSVSQGKNVNETRIYRHSKYIEVQFWLADDNLIDVAKIYPKAMYVTIQRRDGNYYPTLTLRDCEAANELYNHVFRPTTKRHLF